MNPFDSNTNLTAKQISDIEKVRNAFKALLEYDVNFLQVNRYSSLFNTTLEEACMWAIKSITHG